MLYLRICQHFHNKPLFSGDLNTARKTHRHSGRDTERKTNLKPRCLVVPSGDFILMQIFVCVCTFLLAQTVVPAMCLASLPSAQQDSAGTQTRVVTGCCSALGGWPAPLPDPADCQVAFQPKGEKRGRGGGKAPATAGFSSPALSG